VNEKINRFPISSEQEYMKDKKVNYLNYCILVYFSNYQDIQDTFENGNYDCHRYIYEDKILKNKDAIEHYSKTKIQTFIRNAKKIANLSNGEMVFVTKTDEGKIVYKIEKPNKFILIEEKILRILINFCSTNAIKTYVFLKWKCRERGCIISRKEICENIGLSSTGERQLQEITDITKGLQKLGLIKRKTITNVSIDGESYNRSTYYELSTFEDWEEYWESEKNPNNKK
jgi:hypothetical protein